MVLTPENGHAGSSGHLSVALMNKLQRRVVNNLDVL
jgi:hypothetical protein